MNRAVRSRAAGRPRPALRHAVAALLTLAAVLAAVGLVLAAPSPAGATAKTPTPPAKLSPTAVPSLSPPATATPPVDPYAGGEAVQFGEDIHIYAGQSVKTAVAFGGDITVAGTVRENIVAFGGDVRLLPTAVVGTKLASGDPAVVLFGGSLRRSPQAQVHGSVQRFEKLKLGPVLSWMARHSVVRPWWGFTIIGWVVQTAMCLVLALVAAALLPQQMRAVQRQVKARPAASLGWGALVCFIVAPTVLFVLIISVVGWLLLVPAAVVTPLAAFFVTTAVGAFIAQRVLTGAGKAENLILAVILGVVGTTIVSRIPVAGFLTLVTMSVFGVGAACLALAEWRQKSRAAGAGAVLEAQAGTVPAIAAGGGPPAETGVEYNTDKPAPTPDQASGAGGTEGDA